MNIIRGMYFFFVVLGSVTFLYIIIVYVKHGESSFCFTFYSHGGSYIIDITLILLLMILMSIMPSVYMYIAIVVSKRKTNAATTVREQTERKRSLNIIVSSFWVVFTFVICYTPYALVRLLMRFGSHHFSDGQSDRLLSVSYYLGLLPLFNCILDPLIYGTKLPRIREGFTTC